MPELPEVETVKNTLLDCVLNRKVISSDLVYPKIIKSELDLTSLVGKNIEDVKRKGKFIIINFSDDYNLILHLRMEGKIFYLEEKMNENIKHLSFSLTLDRGYLYFFDTRRFAVAYVIRGKDYEKEEPLCNVGNDPFTIDKNGFYEVIKDDKRMIKQILLDQTLISGIGNIYADEILFASGVSPFASGSSLDFKQVESLINNAKRIMELSIKLGGSTVKSYQSSKDHSGSYQDRLKVYGRVGKKCYVCNNKINKRFLNGRGTSYCPHCQDKKSVVAITGTIGAGKSEVAKIFVENGFVLYDCDKKVHELYENDDFVRAIKERFKEFSEGFDKELLLKLLMNDKSFKRKYESYIYNYIKDDLNSFLIARHDEDVVIEAPTYFKAGLDKYVPQYIFVDADIKTRVERLERRGQQNVDDMIKLNDLSDKEKRKGAADFIIENEGARIELGQSVKDIIERIRKDEH